VDFARVLSGCCRIDTLERREWWNIGFSGSLLDHQSKAHEGRVPTTGLMSLGGGRGQESIGHARRVTSATCERTLSRSKTLKSRALAR
jgi:hypothetical protein